MRANKGFTIQDYYVNTPMQYTAIIMAVKIEIPKHYANTPMQYTAIFHGSKNVHFQMKSLIFFLIFAQNIEAVLTSTHNLCFGATIGKSIPL